MKHRQGYKSFTSSGLKRPAYLASKEDDYSIKLVLSTSTLLFLVKISELLGFGFKNNILLISCVKAYCFCFDLVFSWSSSAYIPPLCMLGDSIKGLRFPSACRECPGKTTKVFLKKTTTSQPGPSEKMHGKAASNKGLAFCPYQQQQTICDAQWPFPGFPVATSVIQWVNSKLMSLTRTVFFSQVEALTHRAPARYWTP